MTGALEFKSCEEVGAELIDAAFDPHGTPHPAQRVLRLLERMARVSKPNAGAPRILMVLARLAEADWIDGNLEVTLRDFGVATEVDVRVDNGRLRVRWRTFSLAAPLSELSEWLKKNPAAVRPLAPFGEPIAEELRLRARNSSPPLAPEPPVVSTSPGGRVDPHVKATLRMAAVKVPEEARRTQPGLKAPAPVAEATPEAPAAAPRPGTEDEGWDWD